MLKEFKAFIARGNVVDLAVGVIVGGAFGKIVTSLVNDVIMPPVGVLVGGIDFNKLGITLKPAVGETKAVTINYGAFINNVIDFLIVAFCVFLLVKAVNKLKDQPAPPAPTEKKCPECLMLVPIGAKKCGHCASVISSHGPKI
jgi:large conductance mechanosensitive channel